MRALMAIIFSRARIAFITVVLFFIYGCDNRKDPYRDINCLENLQVLSNNDVLPQAVEGEYNYLYYDTLYIDSTVNYTYSSKYISECSGQIKYNKEFGELTHNKDENTIQFSPLKAGTTDIEITLTDPWSKIYEIRLALTIKKNIVVINQLPIVEAELKIIGDKLYINPEGSYDPDGEIVSYKYTIEDCDFEVTTDKLTIYTIDLNTISCEPPFDLIIKAKDDYGDWSKETRYFINP